MTRCPLCGGDGWTERADGRLERCECWRAARLGAVQGAARIPARFKAATFDTFKPQRANRDALETARAFARTYPAADRGLLLYGPPGTGKTHLAVAVLKELTSQGVPGVFYQVGDLLRTVRGAYAGDVGPETEVSALQPVMETPIVVLDDVGGERLTHWGQDTIGQVINVRYNAKLATIITSGLSDGPATDPHSFCVHLGLRTRSRLKEMTAWARLDIISK